MKNLEQANGITLIALVITIIVMLILARITINLTIGQDGILRRAQESGKNYTNAEDYEREQLAELLNQTDNIIANVTGGNKGNDTEEDKEIIISNVDIKIGTSYVNIVVDAKSKTEKNLTYKYIIDENEITETVQNEYKIENLEAESTHNIKIIVTDGNQEETYTKTIITKEKVYLYNYGDEKETLTGGYTSTVGEANIVIDKTTDCIKVTGNKTNSWGYICSNKKIDIKNFTKIKIEMEDNGNSGGSHFGMFDIAYNIEDSYNEEIRKITAWPIGSTGNSKTEKEINIEDIEEEVYIRIGAYGSGKWIKIYSIWLEE